METVTLTTGYHDYWTLPGLIYENGLRRSPRGKPTYDLGPTTLLIISPDTALPLNCGRGLNPRVAAVEALQLIGGFQDSNLMVWASPEFEVFREDDGTFWGGYGERIGTQLHDVIRKLNEDPDTRQAVITLWDPSRDNQRGKRDYPCTVTLGFKLLTPETSAISRRTLELNVLMRSNDVWLGTPYDIFQFTQLQLTVAHLLGAQVGVYRHTTWSLHLYAEHVPLLKNLHRPEGQSFQPGGLAQPGDDLRDVQDRIKQIIYTEWPTMPDLGDSCRWYRDRVTPYSGVKGVTRASERTTDLG